MNKIIELRNKRNTLWEQTKNFLEEHRGSDGMVEASAVEQYEKMQADVKALGVEIKRLEDQMEMDNLLSAPTSTPVQTSPSVSRKATKFTATEEYSKAFWDYMRGNGSAEIRNTLSINGGSPAGSEGGFLVPDEFERQLIQALEDNNVMRSLGHVIRTTSGVRTIPVAMDNGEASWVEEGNAITGTDPSFAVQTLSSYKLADLIKVTNELLSDSAFDIGAYIAQRFGARFGNAEEKAFISGKGPSLNPAVTPSEPTGILTTLSTPSVSTADASTISFDDLFSLYYALKAPYRRNANFLCSDSVMLRLMTLKDGRGDYLWKPSLEVGKPDTLLGRPIYTSVYMPGLTGTAATDEGKQVVLFGDFSYYWIADRQNRTLTRLPERYAEYDQTGFRATQRVDGKLILPEAMKVLAMGEVAGG